MPLAARIGCVALLAAAIVGGGAVGRAPAAASPRAPRDAAHDAALGRRLVTRFLNLSHEQDVAGLHAFLSPAFQVQRFDGSGAWRAAFLRSIGTTLIISEFRLTSFKVTRYDGVLVARFIARTTQIVHGVLYSSAPAPRLETFHLAGARWEMTSNSNFNAPAAAKPAAPKFAVPSI